MPRPRNPNADDIRNDYLSGMMKQDIADKYGVNYSTVRQHTDGMGRVRPYSDTTRRKSVMKAGRIGVVSSLSDAHLYALDRFARKIGCETLSEAALEILRDELEEML